MIYCLYILAALLVIQGLYSLVEGLKYHSFVVRSLGVPQGSYLPQVAVIAPCKGLEHDLEANLRALFEQDYPEYEVVFAIASPDDTSRPVIEHVMAQHADRTSRLVVAGPAQGRSEKINNLLCALDAVPERCEALVFVDSDARVHRYWLKALVSRLDEPGIGAATGYRWYLSNKRGFWSALLAAWNGSVATTLGDHNRNFAWGGSTAIKRDVFEHIGVTGRWQNAVSDDYALTRAVQQAGLRVAYVPSCLVPTRQDATLSELLEFTTRQVIITRVYRPNVWRVGFASNLLFCLVFFGGIVLGARMATHGQDVSALFVMITTTYLLGSIKGALRLVGAGAALSEHRREVLHLWWMFVLLWPLVSLVFLYNFLRSATTRRITWRGVVYELRSPSDTIVMR